MVVTEKRHMYETGTVNVETGNVVVKQDINYYNANVQSATRSIIRFIEDSDRRFSQNQIYDGGTVSNGGSTVDVASGTLKIGGRWVSLSGTGISAAVSDDTYFIVAQVTGVSETNSRDPSGGEAVTLTLVASGSYSATDWKLVLGSAVIATSGVTSVQDRAKRQVNATIIKPYGSATQVSIYTGDSPVYREAIRFTADKIYPYNNIESAFDVTGNRISGTTLDVSGQTNLADVSGSAISAASYQIGSEVLGITIFQYLAVLDQPLDTAQSPSFVQITSTQDDTAPPLIVASTGTVANLNADLLDSQHAPAGDLVGTSDLQTLNNKTLLTPTIVSYISGTHNHQNNAGGAVLGINVATSGTLLVPQGGTGLATLTDGGHILGDAANTLEVTARPTTSQILIGQASGSPLLKSLNGGATMDANGLVSIVASQHTHTRLVNTEVYSAPAIYTGKIQTPTVIINPYNVDGDLADSSDVLVFVAPGRNGATIDSGKVTLKCTSGTTEVVEVQYGKLSQAGVYTEVDDDIYSLSTGESHTFSLGGGGWTIASGEAVVFWVTMFGANTARVEVQTMELRYGDYF